MSKEGENMNKENKGGGGVGGRAKISANVTLTLRGKDGEIKQEQYIKNLMVDAGLDAAIKQILGDGGAQPDEFSFIGIGIDGTSPTPSDTTLASEIGARVEDTAPDFPTTGFGRLISIFAAGNGIGTVVESGVFNASTSGAMLARTTFTGIVKSSDDSLQVTWEFTLS